MDFFDGYIEFKRTMFLGQQGLDINEKSYQDYLAKHGQEIAIGYLQAMSDFTAHMEVILGAGFCRNGIPESAHSVRKNLGSFVQHTNNFLEAHRSILKSKLDL